MVPSVSVPLRKRLYVWSVILEPLSFFILFEESFSGVSGNLSRLLQALVLIVLAIRFVLAFTGIAGGASGAFSKPTMPLYRYFWLYMAVTIIGGIVGALTNAYAIPGAYQPPNTQSSFAAMINSPGLRPIFEYIVALYYFLYFVVLSRHILRTTADLNYAFSRFRFVFVASFVIGIIDAISSSFGVYLVGRHIADWGRVRVDPGRFHGLAGEPRQAVAYLLLGLAVFHLEARFRGRPLSRWWIAGIVAAVLLTQSASGLVGIMLFAMLYAAYAMWTISPKRLFQLVTVFTLSVVLVYASAVNSKRIMDYVRDASGVWRALESDEPLPELMSKANSDIYPLYDLTRKVRSLDLMPVIFGSGFGSASAVTNRYYKTGAMTNPHSQLARSLYESGVLGTFFLIMSFAYPVKAATRRMPTADQRVFMLLMLLLVGTFLGYRTAAPFVYLGMFAAAFAVSFARAAQGVSLRAPAAIGDGVTSGEGPRAGQPTLTPRHP